MHLTFQQALIGYIPLLRQFYNGDTYVWTNYGMRILLVSWAVGLILYTIGYLRVITVQDILKIILTSSFFVIIFCEIVIIRIFNHSVVISTTLSIKVFYYSKQFALATSINDFLCLVRYTVRIVPLIPSYWPFCFSSLLLVQVPEEFVAGFVGSTTQFNFQSFLLIRELNYSCRAPLRTCTFEVTTLGYVDFLSLYCSMKPTLKSCDNNVQKKLILLRAPI